MAEWHAGAGATLKLNVNLSARQFAEPTLPAQVKRMISESGARARRVWLEITEDTLLQDRDAADRALRQLHEIGVRLVIDDFGAGALVARVVEAVPARRDQDRPRVRRRPRPRPGQ